jgi:hypothetical protein
VGHKSDFHIPISQDASRRTRSGHRTPSKKRPQSALIASSSPRVPTRQSFADSFSDTSGSVNNVFKISITKNAPKTHSRPSHSLKDSSAARHQQKRSSFFALNGDVDDEWSLSDEESSHEASSLGQRIEALARKNTVKFVESLEECEVKNEKSSPRGVIHITARAAVYG